MPITLMPHQQEWVDRVLYGDLAGQSGIPLFGEPGTGKTHPSCEVAAELLNTYAGHALFVVPTRLVWNWLIELLRIRTEIPSIQTVVINGTAKERYAQLAYMDTFMRLGSMFVIIGYDALRIEQQTMQSYDFTVVVADEAHKCKNPHTQTTRAVKSINAKFRIALTGTPITNRPNDLWSILHFLDPGPETWRTTRPTPPRPGKDCPIPKDRRSSTVYVHGCQYCADWLNIGEECKHNANRAGKPGTRIRYRNSSPIWGNYDAFVASYCHTQSIPIRGGRTVTKIVGGKNMDSLHRRLEGFGMTRWLVDDVLKLKPLIFQHVRLEPTTEERQNYKRIQSGLIALLEEHDNGLTMSYFEKRNPLAMITYLRQATTLTPTAFAALRGGLLDEVLEHAGKLAISDISSKEEWILGLLEELNGAKVLIYAHWIGVLDHLMDTLEKHGIKAVGIYGNHNKSPKDAVRIMEQFAMGPELRVIVGNESMSEGINLQAARYVVFMHLPWVPKDVTQFMGRARRYHQERTVIAYFLSHRGTIDEAMAETCMEKQSASDSILDPEFTNGRADMFDVQTGRGLINLIRGNP